MATRDFIAARTGMAQWYPEGGQAEAKFCACKPESLETGDRCSQMAAYAAHSDSLNNLIIACFST